MLPTDIRPDSEYDLQASFLCVLHKGINVVVFIGDILTRLIFDIIPINVAKDSIQAHCPSHSKSSSPILPWDTLWIHLAPNNLERFIIEEESSCIVRKGTSKGWPCMGNSRKSKTKCSKIPHHDSRYRSKRPCFVNICKLANRLTWIRLFIYTRLASLATLFTLHYSISEIRLNFIMVISFDPEIDSSPRGRAKVSGIMDLYYMSTAENNSSYILHQNSWDRQMLWSFDTTTLIARLCMEISRKIRTTLWAIIGFIGWTRLKTQSARILISRSYGISLIVALRPPFQCDSHPSCNHLLNNRTISLLDSFLK